MKITSIVLFIAFLLIPPDSFGFCDFGEKVIKKMGFKPLKVSPPHKIKVAVVDLAIPVGHRCFKEIKFSDNYTEKPLDKSIKKYHKNAMGFHGLEMYLLIKAINPHADIRFFPLYDTKDKAVAEVIREAIEWGPDIINYSLQGDKGEEFILERAAFRHAQKMNITIVAAAGNHGENLEENEFWPAEYVRENMRNVISVTTPKNINFEGNYSPEIIHFETVGVGIPVPINQFNFSGLNSGTSPATALTTGLLSYMMGYVNLTTQESRKQALVKTASGPSLRSMYGKIDFSKANFFKKDIPIEDEKPQANLSARVALLPNSSKKKDEEELFKKLRSLKKKNSKTKTLNP